MTLSGHGRRRWLAGHPWVFAGDVARADGEPGDLVAVSGPRGEPLGWGLYSPTSKIAVRLVSRGGDRPDAAFWLARVQRCVELREALGLLDPRGACRLVSGDAEGLPGLVADRYADVLVLQSGTPAGDRMCGSLAGWLAECLPFPLRAVLDRSDSVVRRLEGLEPRVEWLRGEASAPIEIVEAEEPGAPRLAYEVSVLSGHKTGHYLDQRDNRRRAARFAAGRAVLDVFSYDGLFGIRAALSGAKSVVCIDQSAEAGERCFANAERNGVSARVRFERANAMHDLRRRAEEGERYGLAIVDPPAFARNKRELAGAARGYRELNRRALSLLDGGGVLVSASCSYHVRRDAFLDHLAAASLASGREAWLIDYAGASPDHPVAPWLPESEYLKCAFLRAG